MHLFRIALVASLLLLLHVKGSCQTDCCEDSPFFVSAKFLYWKATEDNLEYVDKFDVVPPGTRIIVNGRPQDIDFTWDPGAQVSLGYACGLCDVALTWTFFHSHANASTSVSGLFDIHFLKPTWFPFLLGALADRASADWKLWFHTLDLEVGKAFCIGQCASLHPYTGLRAAWIDQRYKADYHGAYQFIAGGAPATTLFDDTSFHAKNDFKAIGLRFGIDGEWAFRPCWSLIGGISTSLLYGHFDIKEVIDGNLILDIGAGPQLVQEILTLKETFNRPRFNIEGSLGLQYRRLFSVWNSCFTAALFYDVNIWINQNQLLNRIVFTDSTPINADARNANINESIEHQMGNLQLSGFSLQFYFDKVF